MLLLKRFDFFFPNLGTATTLYSWPFIGSALLAQRIKVECGNEIHVYVHLIPQRMALRFILYPALGTFNLQLTLIFSSTRNKSRNGLQLGSDGMWHF